MNDTSRNKIIVRTSLIGIIVNVMLAGMKATVGLIVNSIAVILDAVNNLSDALSSVITIVGAKLAGKKPNKKHPLGYGRIEYLSAMIVSAIVLYAGITAIVESIKKIISPDNANYSTLSLILISVAVGVKIILGLFVIKQGNKTNSLSLKASGKDALFDAILSSSVLACAIISLTTGVYLEAYIGIIIGLFIIKAGLEMMLETVNDILGKRVDAELSKKIKATIMEEEGVLGAYDLLVNNYGPNKDYASVHIELCENTTASEIDKKTRRIQENVYNKTGIILSGVSIYSFNTKDEFAKEARDKIKEKVLSHNGVLGFHGFFLDQERKDIRFDTVISFDANPSEVIENITKEVLELYPGYRVVISPDVDLSD